jgi:hypothetical protein
MSDRADQLILDQVHRYEGTVNQFLGARARALVERLAPAVPDARSRRKFSALGESLATDPVTAYR